LVGSEEELVQRRATIHDVARHAGVGVKTVSRVLNGERAVSESTRTRVLDSITALDYRPNGAARMLRRNPGPSIGYVCEDIAEPVQARLARAIEAVAADHGATLTVSLTHHDPDRERQVIESLLARRVDGLLLWPTGNGGTFLQRLVRTVPVVCLDRPIDGVRTDAVFCDNEDGARDAVSTLLRDRHRRIAFVGDQPELFTQTERLQGYRSALAQAGIGVDPQLIFRRAQEPTSLAKQLGYWRALPSPPTAVFAASSLSATALVRAMIIAPADSTLVIMGFDDFPLADVVHGGVTVMAQDVDATGSIAAQTLFRRLAGERGDAELIRVPPVLVPRGRA
jgi:LacI family transcriptional regulator